MLLCLLPRRGQAPQVEVWQAPACKQFSSQVQYLNMFSRDKEYTFEKGQQLFVVCQQQGSIGVPEIMGVVELLQQEVRFMPLKAQSMIPRLYTVPWHGMLVV